MHAQAIAQRPHPPGSAEHTRVREYIVAQLTSLGLEPHLQETTAIGTRYPTVGHVVNILARVQGRTPGGKAVLIAAHYDGVWAAPAAGDDGGGVSALLEALRALRSGAPLEHDVIALFTDGEESGLLGAAAFVREHPWAKDVEVALNFEARGTTGRSMMFETGPGNLDVARVLSTLPDVTAGSLMVTVYRSLPNDTDLSEFSQLGKPALNFAFVDGVERYHTSHDDLKHLNAGSVQHHGMQMLALLRAFGNGPLPRPATADAIFFDAPFVGVVVYPESWGVPMAMIVVVIVVLLVARTVRRQPTWGRGMALGAAGMLLTTAISAFVSLRLGAGLDALHARMGWDGQPSWRAVYAAALALLALAGSASAWALARKWTTAATLHLGALSVWTLLVVITAVRLPGVSYLFAWPVGAVALAAWAERTGAASWLAVIARWGATGIACSLLVPVIYSMGGYTLPLNGPGGAAVGALVPMLAWLLAPHLEALGGDRRWASAGLLAAASLAVLAYGAATVRCNAEYPSVLNLAYVTSVDADSAWLTGPISAAGGGPFAAAAFGPAPRTVQSPTGADSSMQWVFAATARTQGMVVRGTPRTITDGPEAAVVTDSTIGDARRVTVRVRAPSGTLSYLVRGPAFMRAMTVDGRALDTRRYRRVPPTMSLPFAAPPDSGFTMVIDFPRDSTAWLGLTAVMPGLVVIPGTRIPARPTDVVTAQNGDVTIRYRRFQLPARE